MKLTVGKTALEQEIDNKSVLQSETQNMNPKAEHAKSFTEQEKANQKNKYCTSQAQDLNEKCQC